MNKRMKIVLTVVAIGVLASASTIYFAWNKAHRNVENEKGIQITASQLVKEYQQNEAIANEKYLDKAIEVVGKVSAVNNNQDGKTTLTISTEDPFASVFCTLKSTEEIIAGTDIRVKGICSGMLSDVRLREAVVVR